MLYSFFVIKKTIKNRQALHEIIRALSLSINFVERSFKPVYPTMVVKVLNVWKITIPGRFTLKSKY